MQGALGNARVGGRRELRPREIGLEELIRDDEPAALIAVEQVVPAGEPEVFHLFSSASRTAGRGIEPGGLRQRRQEGDALDRRLCRALNEKIAVLGKLAPQSPTLTLPRLRGREGWGSKPRQIPFRDFTESMLLPGVEDGHQMACKTLHQAVGSEFPEALIFECSGKRIKTRVVLAHGDGADHGSKDEPFRCLIFIGALGPGEAPATDKPAFDAYPVRPVECNGKLRGGGG